MPILALDVGSSSVRALLFENNIEGVELIPDAISQRKYQFDTDELGQATVDPDFLRHLLEDCIDEILEHPAAKGIEALAMATFAGNWGFFRFEPHEAISPLYTYADTRSSSIAADFAGMRESKNKATLLQSTGAAFHSAYMFVQILFGIESLKKSERQYAQVRDFGSYVYANWMQNPAETIPMSYSMAAWSGMLNRQNLEWYDPFLENLRRYDLENSFAKLADYKQAQIGLNENYSKRWPQLAQIPFFLAVGDGAAAQVGSGAVAKGTAALTIGTTAAIRRVSRETLPTVPSGCWAYRIDKESHLIGGALSEGGNIFAWARENLNLSQLDIEAEISQLAPDSHGLTILPLLNGERSPNWRGDAVGTIHGLRLSTKPIEILHALLEGVALRLATIAKQLEIESETIMMAAGGALHASPAWAQIICDALGRDLHVLADAEVTALGVAHLAHCALLGKEVSGAKPKVAKIYKPNIEHTKIYIQAQARQMALYEILYR